MIKLKVKNKIQHNMFWIYMHAFINCDTHCDDLGIELCRHTGRTGFANEELVESLHRICGHQLQRIRGRCWEWKNQWKSNKNVKNIWVKLLSHHMAQGHDTEKGLTARLDWVQGECRQQVLQKTQHMESGCVFFAALSQIKRQNISYSIIIIKN